jgi:hypothetical protein
MAFHTCRSTLAIEDGHLLTRQIKLHDASHLD